MLTRTLTEWFLHQGQEVALGALQYGPIPKHIAFIMDGHSRFAFENQLETVEAHSRGLEALSRSLALCFQVGIRHVTVLSFTRDNITRNQHEANTLLYMAMTKLTHMVLYDPLFTRFDVRMKFIGDMSLLRDDVRQDMQKCIESTKNHKRNVLNICVPYSSREEMVESVRSTVAEYSVPVVKSPLNRPVSESRIAKALYMQRLGTLEEDPSEGSDGEDGTAHSTANFTFGSTTSSLSTLTGPLAHSEKGAISSVVDSGVHSMPSTPSCLSVRFPCPDDITASTITKNTMTGESGPLDILVRTSGVNQLGDFMLWQSHEKTDFVVRDTLWPSFGFLDLCTIILEWQWKRREKSLEKQKRAKDQASRRKRSV